MHPPQHLYTSEQELRSLSGTAARSGWILIVAGVILLALALVFGFMRGDSLRYFFHAYLVSFCFYLSIALGALFFVALQHASRAGWSVAVRRVAEVMAANVLLMAVCSCRSCCLCCSAVRRSTLGSTRQSWPAITCWPARAPT